MGRRSIWSKPEIIELAKKFVAATDEVWRLQNGDGPECRHFQKIADVGHYRDHKSTRQGIYVCTPSGRLLGSMNTHNVDAVARMLRESLDEYRSLSRDQRLLPEDAEIAPEHRWEDSYPKVHLDLAMVARDLPESCDPDDDSAADWNQDRIWFSKDESWQWLPQDPADRKAGAEYSLPAPIVSRIARFSIIDTVKGQTSYYGPEEVEGSRIDVTVEQWNGPRAVLHFKGQTRAESPESRGRDYPHGVATELIGRAVWDHEKQAFTEFEIVALGKRWGRTVFNRRKGEQQATPVGFVIRKTPQDAPVIAPSFLFAYRAGWVQRR